jgi:hypothetical protein
MKDLRIVFMGTPDFAVEILKTLVDPLTMEGSTIENTRCKTPDMGLGEPRQLWCDRGGLEHGACTNRSASP